MINKHIITNSLKGQNHQRRAMPYDWITEPTQALNRKDERLSALITVTSSLSFIPEMLSLRYIRLLVFFLFFPAGCFFATAGDIIFSSKETLYSTRTGKSLGELSLSVEVKSLDAKPKELILIIGNEKGDIIEGAGGSKTLWIFNRIMSLNEFKRELKNNDYSLDIKDFKGFVSFSKNDVKFEIKNWAEIVKQTKYTFFTDAALGSELTLKLHCYTATKDKKKSTLDDDAVITLVFRLPSTNKPLATTQPEAVKAAAGGSQAQVQEAAGGGGLSDEEKKKKEEEDAKKAAEAERIQRTNDLNLFITVKNKEIASLLDEIEELAKDKKSTVKTFDSLELVVNEMGKKVEYWDKGYTDILLKEEAIQDKFLKFLSDKTTALKMLAEVKQNSTGLPGWLTPLAMAAGVFMMGAMFVMQIVSRFKAKKQMLKAMQAQGIKLPAKEKKQKGKSKTEEIDTVDINDLYKI